MPILQELTATGGIEEVRFLYERVLPYFPRLSFAPSTNDKEKVAARWRAMVQRAGKLLVDKKQIERRYGHWSITDAGRRRVALEQTSFIDNDEKKESRIATARSAEMPHRAAQTMLLEIGAALGFDVKAEENYFDVVWRATAHNPRLSHVFEVQRRGNIDSALAKLKKAYDAQRSKTFLVVATEGDIKRARLKLNAASSGAFAELEKAVEIISFEQLVRLYQALTLVRELVPMLLER